MRNEKCIQNLPEWEIKQLKAVRNPKKMKDMCKKFMIQKWKIYKSHLAVGKINVRYHIC